MIKVKVNGLKTKTIWDLENFQGNLKKLDKEAKDKLKANILKNGFISPVFVWKGKDYVLDGHQRILVVKELIKEGHELETIDQIPVVEIEAETKKQAGEYVLSYNAQYGKITDEGLLEFGKEFELDFTELTETINLDFPQFELTTDEPDEKEISMEDIKPKNKCPSCGFKW